jgi:iron-sulfur cluster assembly accessory protein
MLDVSEKALAEFKKVLAVEENKGLGVKIKAHVSAGSCCSCGPSQSYEMDLVASGEAGDDMTEREGVKFYSDPETSSLMNGFQVDFLDEHGFIVRDTNAPASSCGCGEGGHGGSCC